MTDRRRNNGPQGGTKPPLYDFMIDSSITPPPRPTRTRSPSTIRNICLVPPASGSAYLEFSPSQLTKSQSHTTLFRTPTLKLSATIHGPRPLPRSAPFVPHLSLTCTLKFTPYASRKRRAYLRDSSERDLGAMLEQALRGIVVGERFPKTGVDVVVTVLEGEEDSWWGSESGTAGWGALSVLSGAITAASAALVDAGIDVLDTCLGGSAALVEEGPEVLLDLNPVEHSAVRAACVVGYIKSRDEMSLVWMKGAVNAEETERLVEGAVNAAIAASKVVDDALRDGLKAKLGRAVE